MPIFELRQIEPPVPGGPLRVLTLKGPAGPVSELSTPVSVRKMLEWVPSSNRGYVRVDGAEYGEITASFRWRTEQLIGTSDAVLGFIDANGVRRTDTVLDTWEAIAEAAVGFTEEPAMCRLTFDGREWVGVVSEVTPTAEKAGHAGCEIVFQPVERKQSRPITIATPFDPQRFSQDIETLFEDGVTASKTQRKPTFRAPDIDATDQAIDSVRTAISDIQVQANSISNPARQIRAVQRGMTFAVAGLTAAGTALVEASISVGEQLAQTDEYVAQIRARLARSTIRATAIRMRANANRERRNLVTTGDALGFYTTIGDETLWAISFAWYGTTRHADAIARRNGLVGPFVGPGVRIVIPKRPEDG
jgi:hypothetical protein